MKAVARVFIGRTPGDVFAFATAWPNYPKWQEGVDESTQTSPGPNGIGTTFRHQSRFMGRKIDVTGEVTEYDPGHAFGYRITSGTFRYTGRQTYEAAPGGTEATYTFDADLGGILGLATPLMRWIANRRIARDYTRLKALMEREGAV